MLETTEQATTATTALDSPIARYLHRLHARYRDLDDGEVATYIPELAKADPEHFGICLVTCDGAIYEVGDTRQPFTIQSISKPLTYGLALEELGEAAVRGMIGVEPTGQPFNAFSLEAETGLPLNPLVNVGAIAAVALLAGADGSRSLDHVLGAYARYAGRPVSVDWAVYESESATGHRNRAMGHLLRAASIVAHDPEPVLELYFQQCAALVDCRDLAVIAATLANGGLNPVTGERAASEANVRGILSVMATCGMYDSAGTWLFDVGLPAKSGVSGGVLAVLPGQLGIGVFSPPLDRAGNSVRGVRVCRDVSQELNLHLIQAGITPPPPIRSAYGIAELGSKRVRTERERAAIAEGGKRAASFELQGEIVFAAAEQIVRTLVEREELELAILDLRRVNEVDPAVVPLFADLGERLEALGGALVLSSVHRHEELVRLLGSPRSFTELDLALEWCEDRLLAELGTEAPARVPLEQHELLRGLPEAGIARVRQILVRRRFAPGELMIRKGDAADELFLILQGHLSVTLDLPGGERRRLATLSSGMVVGELALTTPGARRAADVWADSDVDCYALPADELERLGETDPAVKIAILQNLLQIVARTVRRLNDDLRLLAPR